MRSLQLGVLPISASLCVVIANVRDLALAAAVRNRFPFLTALPPRVFPVDEAALDVPALEVDALADFLEALIA